MEIWIDESGNFSLKGAMKNNWCVTAAYVTPPTVKKHYTRVLRELKHHTKVNIRKEIKLRDISEHHYIDFLRDLNELNGVLFCSATDSGINEVSRVIEHQNGLASWTQQYVGKMRYEGGKKSLEILAHEIGDLSPQLYIQLHLQVCLMESIVRRGINYFVQRNPNSLQKFQWRIDRKAAESKTNFERVFEKLSPGLLQTLSIRHPSELVDGFDYRPMRKFFLEKGGFSEELLEELPHLRDKSSWNIQKIVRDNIEFEDSASSIGIQIADLLAAGLRRLLRLEFNNNEVVARHLGGLMIQAERGELPISFHVFGREQIADRRLEPIVGVMRRFCRPMIKR